MEIVDLDPGARARSKPWSRGRLDHGALEVLGRGVVVDSGTMEALGHDIGSVADCGTVEDLGRGAMADVDQETTRSDPEEHGSMAEQAEQEFMLEQRQGQTT